MFSTFAKWLSRNLGDSRAFMTAMAFIVLWLISGPVFKFSDTWQLIVNTATTIVTFLMVFLLQNTQNRDTVAIQLKLDEIIRAMGNTHNELLKVEELSDQDLEKLLKRYESLAENVKSRIKRGQSDLGSPDIPKKFP